MNLNELLMKRGVELYYAKGRRIAGVITAFDSEFICLEVHGEDGEWKSTELVRRTRSDYFLWGDVRLKLISEAVAALPTAPICPAGRLLEAWLGTVDVCRVFSNDWNFLSGRLIGSCESDGVFMMGAELDFEGRTLSQLVLDEKILDRIELRSKLLSVVSNRYQSNHNR